MLVSLLDDQHQDPLREKLLADMARIVLPVGIAGNISSHIREYALDIPLIATWNTWFISCLIVALIAIELLKHRIPIEARAWASALTLNIAPPLSLITLGSFSPIAYVAPSSIIAGWFLLGPRAGMAFAALDATAFVLAFWLHSRGLVVVPDPSSLEASAAHWLITAVSLALSLSIGLTVLYRITEALLDRQRDLTRLTDELEARVSMRTNALEKAHEEMRAFAYAVSHDLRAPLRAIDGFSRILLEDELERLSPDGQDALRRILAGSSRMNHLIEALLGLSRLDRATVRIQSVDMEQIVRQLHEEIGPGPARWTIGSLPACSTDPDLVRIVFQNLFANATKFSATRPEPRIEVFAEEREDGIWYGVRDNGTGFDMAHAKHLFHMFQRLHDATYEGLGIGLATVKRILDRLEGAIEATGEPGKGATFLFRPTPPATDTAPR
jgi:signal transduction histidine kinase